MAALTKYWQSLNAKEQRLLAIAGGILVLFIVVVGIFRPLNNAIDAAKKEQQKQQAFALFVKQSIATIQANQGSTSTIKGNVSQVVNQTRTRYQVQISKMQSSGKGLRLTIDNVAFNQLLRWLNELSSRHNIAISNIELTEHDTSGYVRVSRLVLE